MDIKEISFQGLEALELSDEAMRLVVIPAWGGKIASIYDLRRQREWLHTNPHFAFELPHYDADYISDYDIGGFDECFPNIGAGLYPNFPWQSAPLPDHGEVWALPWSGDKGGDEVILTVHGVRLPYRLEKRLRLLAGGRLRIDYRLTNLTPFEMPFVWSSHPLLDVQPGMYLEVPASSARVDSCSAGFPAEPGDIISWPLYEGRDLRLICGPDEGLGIKLVGRHLTAGIAALVDPADGARFEFSFDPRQVTHVGMWLNYGGWSGKAGAPPYYNIGLEPCIGVADKLDLALAAGEHGLLPASGQTGWWLELALS